MSAYFQVYKDKTKKYRWMLKDPNHKIIADSCEGYNSEAGCREGLADVIGYVPNARINKLT
jgi:uncharacterized protein YegP (UPF0339 family)